MGEKMHKITMQNYQMQTLQNAFEHFIIRCRVTNLSEETITSYRSKVAHFLVFISPDTALLEIDEKTIEDFIIHLKTRSEASDMQHKGYGKEAISLMLDMAFKEYDMNRVAIGVVRLNINALAFYRKIGFKQEGIQEQGYYYNGEYSDFIMMRILRHEWNKM